MAADCCICETRSNGYHFGVSCCRACAAFFRRTVSLKLAYKCRFQKRCDVKHTMRYSCRYCRFEKCVIKGMRREGRESPMDENMQSPVSMSPVEICGSLPPDIVRPIPQHVAYHETSHSVSTTASSSSPPAQFGSARSSFTPPQPRATPLTSSEQCPSTTVLNIIRNTSAPDLYTEIQMLLKTRINYYFEQRAPIRNQQYAIPLTLCQQALIAYAEHKSRWPNCRIDKLRFASEEHKFDVDRHSKNHFAECEYIALFCMNLDSFVELPCDQKWIVFKHFFPRFYLLDRSFVSGQLLGMNESDARWVSYDGIVFEHNCRYMSNVENVSDMDLQEIKIYMRKSHDILRKMFHLPFKKLKADEFEMVFMTMSTLFNIKKDTDKNVKAETIQLSERMRTRAAEDLNNYYAYQLKKTNYAERLHRMCNMIACLDRVMELRQEDSQMSRAFNIFREDVFMTELLSS